MGPIAITSGLFIAFVVVYFFQIRRKKGLSHSENEILTKYKVFVNLALSQGRTSRLERIKANSLSIRTSNLKTANVFSLTEVEERIIIVWTWPDSGFGRRGKEWSFPNNYDQKKMFDEVLEDVFSYQKATYQKYNQQVPISL